MRRHNGLCWILASLAWHSTSTVLGADDEVPTVEQLVKLAPFLDSSDAEIHRIEIEGRYSSLPLIDHWFRITYQAPDQYTLLIKDALDQTPILYCAGDRAILYDPIEPTIWTFKTHGAYLIANRNPESPMINLRVGLPGPNDGPSLILLNAGSIFNSSEGTNAVEPIEGGTYRLTRIDMQGGNRCLVSVDPSKDFPWERIAFHNEDEDEDEPGLVLERIAINDDVEDRALIWPEFDQICAGLPIQDFDNLDGTAIRKTFTFMEIWSRANFAHGAMRYAEDFDGSEFPGFEDVDPAKLRESSAELSELLRQKWKENTNE